MSILELQPSPIIEVNLKRTFYHSTADFSSLIEEKCRQIQSNKSHIIFLERRNIDSLAVIYACLHAGRPFAFLPANVPQEAFKQARIIQEIERLADDQEDRARDLREKHQFCYMIRTSGSTGPPKVVSVPNRAIWPNIEDFRSRFNITQNDRILFSTSFLFDPSMVEIFLCFLTGATMIMIDDEIRSSPSLLSKVIEEFKPTFVQFTPSLFKMFNFTESNKGMMKSVRIMVLGGEKFPLSFVNQHRATHYPNTKIFDVYGVTEVSCWSTVYEVQPDCKEILIGDPIKNTILRSNSNGNLIIEGPRICVVNTHNPEGYDTRDCVLSTEKGYILQGRTDNIVKFKGMKLCLDQLSEELTQNVSEVEFSRFLLWKKEHLVLFVKFHPSPRSIFDLKALVRDHFSHLAYAVIMIASVPLNNNKKLDTIALEKELEETYTREWRVEQFWEILKRHGIREGMNDALLFDYGITSLTAAELAILLGDEAEIREILAETTTVGFLIEKYLNRTKTERKEENRKIEVVLEEGPTPPAIWEHNMKKCIDGNALIVKYHDEFHVIMASHSGMILKINHTKNTVTWQKTIEEARFEAGPGFAEGKIFIGSYQGHLYVLDFASGEELDHLYFERASIRGQVKGRNKDVVFTTYCEEDKNGNSGQLHVFRYSTSELVSCSIAAGSSTSAHIESQPSSSSREIIVTTIKGTVEHLICDDVPLKLSHKSRLQIGKAIFSPVVRDPHGQLLVTTADGLIAKLDGNQLMKSINLKEAFFAPVHVVTKRDNVIYLAVSQKGNVFFLDSDLTPIRILSFPGCSFVKPLIYSTNEVTLMSTDARLIMIDRRNFWKSRNPRSRAVRMGKKEIFARPMFLNGDIIIGCRDDFARAFRYRDLSKIS